MVMHVGALEKNISDFHVELLNSSEYYSQESVDDIDNLFVYTIFINEMLNG